MQAMMIAVNSRCVASCTGKNRRERRPRVSLGLAMRWKLIERRLSRERRRRATDIKKGRLERRPRWKKSHGPNQVFMMFRPAGRFLMRPLPPFDLAARFLAAVIRPPRDFFAILFSLCGWMGDVAVSETMMSVSGGPAYPV